jgi:prevent-host-death family protein
MSKNYSIAEARHNLAAIVHELEKKPFVELTRRGEPVAVLLSIREFRRLASGKINFWKAYVSFREAVDLPQLDIQPGIFEGTRDEGPGREVNW